MVTQDRLSAINGVHIKELVYWADERGNLMEMLREDDAQFERFGQAYMTTVLYGVVKAWHCHRTQTDCFICVSGTVLLALYDGRKDSPSFGEVENHRLVAPPTHGEFPKRVMIPPGVWHGFTAVQCDVGRLVNLVTHPYCHLDPDELRLPWNSDTIPYDWPRECIKGG